MNTLRSLLFAFILMPALAGAYTLGEPRVRGGVVSAPVAYRTFVYAASGISVDIWNIADAAHPTNVPFASQALTAGPIFGLAIVGDFLYVGWSDGLRTTGGFEIYSLADPAHPAHVGEAATQHADALLANGDYLYAADGQLGVTAIDARDPLHPVVAGVASGSFLLPQSVLAAQVANQHLYISGSAAIENCWAVIFDLADPAHPLSVGTIPLGAFGEIGAVSGSGYALAFGSAGGLYDVRDPAQPAHVGDLPPSSDLTFEGGAFASFRDETLYLFGADALPIYDVSTPSAPSLIAEAPLATNDLFALTPLSDGFLATTLTGRGLVVDASTAASPVLRGEIAMPSASPIGDVALDDRTVYAIGEGHALEVIDAASLDNIAVLDAPADDDGSLIGTGLSIGLSRATAVIGAYRMLFTVDVADRAHPRVAGSLPLDYFGPLLVATDRAYVPTNGGSLAVVDLANPAAPALRGSVPGAIYYLPLAVAGSTVYAFGTDPDFIEGVQIIDARDADHPVIVGHHVPCIGSLFSMLAASSDGATLAIACSDGSVEFVDAHDPTAPALVAMWMPGDPASAATSIAGHGTTFFIGNVYGVDQFDASDAANPVYVTRYPTASWVQSLRLSPEGSLVALTDAGLYLFDCVASGGERPLPCRAFTRIPRSSHAHSHHGSAP